MGAMRKEKNFCIPLFKTCHLLMQQQINQEILNMSEVFLKLVLVKFSFWNCSVTPVLSAVYFESDISPTPKEEFPPPINSFPRSNCIWKDQTVLLVHWAFGVRKSKTPKIYSISKQKPLRSTLNGSLGHVTLQRNGILQGYRGADFPYLKSHPKGTGEQEQIVMTWDNRNVTWKYLRFNMLICNFLFIS